MPSILPPRLRRQPNFPLEYILNGPPSTFIGSLRMGVYESLTIVCILFDKAQVVATSNSAATCTEAWHFRSDFS